MTPKELFEFLDRNGLDYELVEIFEGVRIVAIQVIEEDGATIGVDHDDDE
jgi:hypothetical protein